MSTPATPSELLGRDSPAILHENSSIILIECRDAEDKSNILPKNVEYGRLSNPLELQFKNHTQYRTATVDSSFTRPPFRGEGIPQGPRREWWEYWMDNEESKRSGPYDPHTSTLDRLYEAAADFRKTRYWPGAIAASWDQFRLFVGLLSNTPIWTRTDRPAPESESDDDDDEAEFEAHLANGCGPRKPPPRLRARAPYALYGVEPIPVASDDEVRVLLEAENARREEEMLAFLYDPESKFKVYLSSYMRKQGLV
ncbi:hypothetical protein H0H81_005889 [Sphagnurus paluster]|uniref:Uncharacterized protein n=1 Tax=Sphagnurus paluster TaxID=117069 RepID=A0A9P7K9C0_9AGAR|nr:hypothetical protein H0H81_005889 [Sphagnurus paluster]